MMRYANSGILGNSWMSSKAAMIGAVLFAVLIGRAIGEELCHTEGGTTVIDGETGSFLQAGGTVVGFAQSRDGISFATTPMLCAVYTAAAPELPDCNGDGRSTMQDLACFFECMTGPNAKAEGKCLAYDIDESGTVDQRDWAWWSANN